jgi:predicted GH43/DUF377 family glycosyl hydrolase
MLKKSILILMLTVCLNLIATKAYSQTNWEKFQGNPVLDAGSAGAWDEEGLQHQFVLFDGNTYHMWFDGESGDVRSIGYASSPDGITWTKYENNPVLTSGAPGTWDDFRVSGAVVIFDGTTYHMWYGGVKLPHIATGYATSPDAITWTKYSGNPVLEIGAQGSWDDSWVGPSSVSFDGTTFKMWYNGFDGDILRIGYATSPDGIAWTKHASNQILAPGAFRTWDDYWVFTPHVVFDGNNYLMWYSGHDENTFRIGLATSSDGIAWTKEAANPVLDLGSSGTWESNSVAHPRVILNDTLFQMWYLGRDAPGVLRIGYATSLRNITGVQDEIVNVPLERSLDQNYPNPFNPGTTIKFSLSQSETISLRIFDLNGRLIRTLIESEKRPTGLNTIEWDGKDNQGNPIPSGRYVYTLESGKFKSSKVMTLAK